MSGARPKEYRQGSSSGSDRKQRRSTSGSRDGRRRRGTGGEQQSGSDKQMVTYVIQLLCRHGGQAKVSDLENYVQQQQQQQQQQPQQPLSLLAVMTRNRQQFTLFRLRDGDVLAKVRTDLKLCAKHCTGAGCNGPTCDALHVCKYFLISSCSAEKKQIECDYGHDFGTYYNLSLLQRHGLGGLRPQDLQLIFKLNRSQATLPMTCKFYNGKAGCNKAGGKGCPGMHLCQPFLENRCRSGEGCPRSHNVLDLQPKNILLQYGFNIRESPDVILEELLGQMQNSSSGRTRDSSQEQGYVRPHPISSAALPAAPVSSNNYVKPPKMAAMLGPRDADNDGELNICMFHLRGKCLYGDKCHNKHSRRHFQWQREQSNTAKGTWADFNAKENLELELNFSDPNREGCFLGDRTRVLKVDFAKMILFQERGQAVQVRRLGTTSSVLAPPTHKRTTQWLWFWRDNAQKWIEYGERDTNEGFEAGVTSAKLEEFFHQNQSSKVGFETSGYEYELDFATMTQVNLSVGTERPVRRRPVFDKDTDYTTQKYGSPKDIVALLKDLKLRLEEARPHKTSETIPPHWDFEHVSDNDYFHAVPVMMSGGTLAEYIKIKKLFHKTLPGKTIKCIKRIQNFDLWEKFERKKIKMERKLKSGDTLDERLLFHGTSKQCVDAICQQGFDWRYSGTSTGALYGNGSYFARDAKYSNCYSEDSTMFVARVLVGEFAQGSSGERLPPVKDPRRPYGERYDSCVDDPSDPSIFVIYQDDQSYPEYLIEY